MSFVESSDSIRIAVHDHAPGSPLPVALLAHATGFHGRCFDPVAAHLAGRMHAVSFDFRGHGDSTVPPAGPLRWSGYGDDALAVARTLTPQPLVAAGHSMGGAALVMAALAEPERFAALVLYEPIVFPPEAAAAPPSPLIEGARRRRPRFPDRATALSNYAAKPPLSDLHPDALFAYVEHGFRDTADGDVELKCPPDHEARTYESGATHATWGRLPELRVPVWLVSGAVTPLTASALVEPLSHLIPTVTRVTWPDLGHFGPMQHPSRFADLIASIHKETT